MISHQGGKFSQKELGSSCLGVSQRWGRGDGGRVPGGGGDTVTGTSAGTGFESAPSGENQLPSIPSRLLLLLVCICHLSLLSPWLQAKEGGFSPLIMKWYEFTNELRAGALVSIITSSTN